MHTRSYAAAMVAVAAAIVLAVSLGPTSASDPGPEATAGTGPDQPIEYVVDGLVVRDPWTRATVMVELASAAYMVIHNTTAQDDALVGASSPAAGGVGLHQTTTDDQGSMVMAEVAEIPIPADGDAVLAPGGYHIMLTDLVEPLADGDRIELTVQFATARPLTLAVPVRATGPAPRMAMEPSPDPEAQAAEGTVAADQVAESSVAPEPDAEGTMAPEPELTWAPLVTLRPIGVPPVTSPVELADGFALGAPDAPVTVEVWEDFQCPYCQYFTFEVEPRIVEVFVKAGHVRLVFRNLAFLGDESHWAAVAASLAAEQDLFWPYHDYLYANLQGENVGSYSLERLLQIGETVGLDMGDFRQGLQLDAARARFAGIEAEARRDAGSLGINRTPTVVVAGVPLQAPDFETVSAAIEAALGAAEVDEADPAPVGG